MRKFLNPISILFLYTLFLVIIVYLDLFVGSLLASILPLLVTIVSPILGLSTYVILYPIETYVFEHQLSIYTFPILVVLLCIPILRKLLMKNDFNNKPQHYLIFGWIFIIGLLISWLINTVETGGNLLIILHVIFAGLIAWYTSRDVRTAKVLLIAAILSSISIVIIVFPDFFIGDIRRLSLGGSVRGLSNTVGLGLLISVSWLIIPDKFSLLNKKVLLVPISIAIIQVFTLIASSSRGVIISVIVALSVMWVSLMFKNQVKIKVSRLILMGFGLLAFFYIESNYIDVQNFEISRLGELDMGGRENIWLAAINELEGVQLLFGAGQGSFKELAIMGGYDYYAHSVYIDTFVSLGLFGFLILVGYIIVILIRSYHKLNPTALSLVTFLILNFSTHGNLHSRLYWITFGLIIGIATLKQFNRSLSFDKLKFNLNDRQKVEHSTDKLVVYK